MDKIVVADTGPLIALALVGLLPALPALFAEVYAPEGVLAEALQNPVKPGATQIQRALERHWIVPHAVALNGTFAELAELLDQGEAEALALAEQLRAIVLIDERRGRRVAARRGIAVTGTAAVLLRAKQAGRIDALKPLIERLTAHGYRLSSGLIAELLHRAGE